MGGRHVQKHVRLILRGAREIGESKGALITLDPEGSHQTLIIELDGRRRLVTLSSSPRDKDHAMQHAMQQVRRSLRELTEGDQQ